MDVCVSFCHLSSFLACVIRRAVKKGPQEGFPLCIFEKPVDLATCESAHFPATAYLPFLKEQPNVKQLCFNHYTDAHLPSIPEMKNTLQHMPVFHAADGMEIVL